MEDRNRLLGSTALAFGVGLSTVGTEIHDPFDAFLFSSSHLLKWRSAHLHGRVKALQLILDRT